jgi:uncharacterized caspase-like protein
VPVEDTDGPFIRIAVSAETTGGSKGERQILRLRRPEAEAHRGRLRVLAIGIGDYAKLPKLGFAAAEAKDLAAALQEQAGYDRLYRTAAVKVLTDREATLPAIRSALAWLTRSVQPGETLVLHFSGHGLKQGRNYYFAPPEVDPKTLTGTGLPWKEVLAPLQAARRKAKAIWVLADCCRAAPGLESDRQATPRDLRRGIDAGGNLVLCPASSGDAPSYESDTLKHGLFTQAWLEALRGEAPEIVYQETARGRVLTMDGLQFAVGASVRQRARKAGVVRQEVEFPQELLVSFSPNQPVFMPIPKR